MELISLTNNTTLDCRKLLFRCHSWPIVYLPIWKGCCSCDEAALHSLKLLIAYYYTVSLKYQV